MPVHIKLYGEKAERFEAISSNLAEQLGYEPSNPEIVGVLMGLCKQTTDRSGLDCCLEVLWEQAPSRPVG